MKRVDQLLQLEHKYPRDWSNSIMYTTIVIIAWSLVTISIPYSADNVLL